MGSRRGIAGFLLGFLLASTFAWAQGIPIPFPLTSAQGNTAIAGTLNVTGQTTLSTLSLVGPVTFTTGDDHAIYGASAEFLVLCSDFDNCNASITILENGVSSTLNLDAAGLMQISGGSLLISQFDVSMNGLPASSTGANQKVVCINSVTGRLYVSATALDCS